VERLKIFVANSSSLGRTDSKIYGGGIAAVIIDTTREQTPLRRHANFLSCDIGSGIEYWVVNRYMQMGLNPSATRIAIGMMRSPLSRRC